MSNKDMEKYPQISSPIRHSPRPTTDVLHKDQLNAMSTSPSLQPQIRFEPTPNSPAIAHSDVNDQGTYPQLVLFGDSITQFGTLTLQAYLQTQYIRRLDVVNRGFSGFTLPMGIQALTKFLPCNTPLAAWPRVRIMTVFFGANDACVPGQSQHVELQQYVENIKEVIDYPVFRDNGRTEIIIITPPPVNEHQFEKLPTGCFQRRAGTTSQYARAAQEAGRVYGVHVLDFWTVLMQKVGWTASMGRDCCCKHIPCHIDTEAAVLRRSVQHIPGCEHFPSSYGDAEYKLSDFLTDGLHLTKLAYDVLFWELMKLIRRDLPSLAPEALPFVLPDWKEALQTHEHFSSAT